MNSNLPGVNVLLMGPTGTGKTYAQGTLVDYAAANEMEVFYLATEAGMESLLGYWTDEGLPIPKNLHWHFLKAPASGISSLIDMAKKINTLSYKSLMDMADPDKSKYNYFIQFLTVLNGFTDQRTGENFGPVDKWGVDKILILDSLSGINQAAMANTIGGKPVPNQNDWQPAQNQVERMMRTLTTDCPCHFICLAHVDREPDMITGSTKIMVATLGQKLAPKLPPMFSDVILSVREGTNFYWSTASTQADVKARNLPLADKIKPNFSQIMERWVSRAYSGEVKSE